MIVGIAALILALVGLLCMALFAAVDFDSDPALFMGYIATPAAFAWGFVGLCLAVVNLYDHGGMEPKSRLALVLSISAVLCSGAVAAIALFGGLI